MTHDLIGEAVVGLALMAGFLVVLGVGGLVADYVFPHIPFIQRYLDSLPDWDDEVEEYEMVTNYAEWKAAVAAEHKKLVDVDLFLNDDGKERMRVFDILGTLASLSTTPEELLAWIESKEDFDKSEVAAVESDHARLAIKALRNIAKKDDKHKLVPMPGTEGDWGEKFWGGK